MLRASILCTAIAAATALQPFQTNSVYFADPNGTNTTAPTVEPVLNCTSAGGVPCSPNSKPVQLCPLKPNEPKEDACPSDGCCRGPFAPTPPPTLPKRTPAPTLSPTNVSTPAPADTPTPPPAPSPATPAPLDPSTVPAEVIVVISNATYIAAALLEQIADSTHQPVSRFTVTDTKIGKNDTTLQMTILAQSTPDVNGSSYNDTADAVADLMISAWVKGDFRAEGVSLVAKVTAAPTLVPTLAPTTNGTNGTTGTPTAPPATATPTNSASNAAVSMALFVVLGLAYL